jgi:hypothetical protein
MMNISAFNHSCVLALIPVILLACASIKGPSVPPLEVVSYVDLKR